MPSRGWVDSLPLPSPLRGGAGGGVSGGNLARAGAADTAASCGRAPLLLLPALALPLASVSCPWSGDASTARSVPSPEPAALATRRRPRRRRPPRPSPRSRPRSRPTRRSRAPHHAPAGARRRRLRRRRTTPSRPASAPRRARRCARARQHRARRPGSSPSRTGRRGASATCARAPSSSGAPSRRARNHACPEGWYRIEPRGYVCVGATATLNVSDAVVETSAKRPRRDGLPYTYVMSRSPAPPFYARLPSAEEALRVEPDLAGHLRSAAQMALDPSYVAPPPAEPVPGVLLYGRSAPGLAGEHGAHRRRSPSGSARAAIGLRAPLDLRLRGAPLRAHHRARGAAARSHAGDQAERFTGITLDDEVTLPVAFVKRPPRDPLRRRAGRRSRGASRSASGRRCPSPAGSGASAARRTSWRSDGSLLRAEPGGAVDRLQHMPAWAAGSAALDRRLHPAPEPGRLRGRGSPST